MKSIQPNHHQRGRQINAQNMPAYHSAVVRPCPVAAAVLAVRPHPGTTAIVGTASCWHAIRGATKSSELPRLGCQTAGNRLPYSSPSQPIPLSSLEVDDFSVLVPLFIMLLMTCVFGVVPTFRSLGIPIPSKVSKILATPAS